ncbi:MAG: heparan-alpha-glucosaminide N-acetyltransferase domain-containing protein [Candidatus Heimdallarchaeota archaeon]
MKRLTSMDFARGLAIFGMTIFHVFLNDWDFMTTGNLGAL